MKCRVCSSQGKHQQFTAREMMLGLRDPFTYFQCADCQCLQISDFPSNISAYYPDEYHSFEALSEPNALKKYLRTKRNQYAIFEDTLIGKLLYKNKPEPAIRSLSYLPLNYDTTILDVGCGSGKLLFSLKELGFNNLTGIDPFNKEDINAGNGLNIWRKNIHEIDGKWDLIMMHHSFEHVPDPEEVLKSITQHLAPSGSCLIRIPVVNSFAWENYRENWVQLDAPRHYFLHSQKSMEILARKAGLQIQKVIYDSTSFQFWGSIQYEKDIPLNDARSHAVNSSKSIFSDDELLDFEQRTEELNSKEKGDQAVYILQKG